MKNKVTALILAGGLGTRLRPLTFSIPKPMVALNGRPILVRLIEHLRHFDIVNIFLSTGYMSNIIEAYIGSGEGFHVNIGYLKEERPLGTAGPLSLLDEKTTKDYILVLNGDIYTTLDINNFINFHIATNSVITVGTKEYEVESRYGSIEVEGDIVTGIQEKPTYKSIISCGMYVLNKDLLKVINKEEFLTMPDLINQCIKDSKKVSHYMFSEDWMPVEDIDDLTTVSNQITDKES